MSKRWAIYYLIDPRTEGVRYVGYACDPYQRFINHCGDMDETHKTHWIRELHRATGNLPVLSIRCWLETRNEAKRIEVALIATLRARGVNLTNTTDGGDGGAGMRGRKHSDATRQKMSNSAKGRVISLEQRAKLSALYKGRKNPAHSARLKGRPLLSQRRRRIIHCCICGNEREVTLRYPVETCSRSCGQKLLKKRVDDEVMHLLSERKGVPQKVSAGTRARRDEASTYQ